MATKLTSIITDFQRLIRAPFKGVTQGLAFGSGSFQRKAGLGVLSSTLLSLTIGGIIIWVFLKITGVLD